METNGPNVSVKIVRIPMSMYAVGRADYQWLPTTSIERPIGARWDIYEDDYDSDDDLPPQTDSVFSCCAPIHRLASVVSPLLVGLL